MNCNLNTSVRQNYHSQSQIIRILTENWLKNNMYCPHCGYGSLNHFPNNKAVADFYCPICRNEYELKSKAGNIGHKIADGAYHTFIDRITSNNNPDFFVLNYNKQYLYVNNLWIIPKHFFVPDIVEQRKPLSDNAKRKGWIGCNILIDKIPNQAKIEVVHNKIPVPKELVQAQMQQASLLYTSNLSSRGWIMDVLKCIDSIQAETFSLSEMYQFETELTIKHPNNHNIKAKIRQQLQLLRDKGFLDFLDRGIYKKILKCQSFHIEKRQNVIHDFD